MLYNPHPTSFLLIIYWPEDTKVVSLMNGASVFPGHSLTGILTVNLAKRSMDPKWRWFLQVQVVWEHSSLARVWRKKEAWWVEICLKDTYSRDSPQRENRRVTLKQTLAMGELSGYIGLVCPPASPAHQAVRWREASSFCMYLGFNIVSSTYRDLLIVKM